MAAEAAARCRAEFDLPLALIVVDTLTAAAGFDDENSASETQKVMNTLRELSRVTGALVLAIDHLGKIAETGVRGSSAKATTADAILACLGEKTIEGRVTNRRMAVSKLRSASAGRVTPFALKVADDGCIVEWKTDAASVPPMADTARRPKSWPPSLLIFKRALESAWPERIPPSRALRRRCRPCPSPLRREACRQNRPTPWRW